MIAVDANKAAISLFRPHIFALLRLDECKSLLSGMRRFEELGLIAHRPAITSPRGQVALVRLQRYTGRASAQPPIARHSRF